MGKAGMKDPVCIPSGSTLCVCTKRQWGNLNTGRGLNWRSSSRSVYGLSVFNLWLQHPTNLIPNRKHFVDSHAHPLRQNPSSAGNHFYLSYRAQGRIVPDPKRKQEIVHHEQWQEPIPVGPGRPPKGKVFDE